MDLHFNKKYFNGFGETYIVSELGNTITVYFIVC